MELHIRPSLIRHTNHIQDSCERLEQTLREEKRERDNIRCALHPVRQDRNTLAEQVARRTAKSEDNQAATNNMDAKNGPSLGQARFIRTYTMPHKVVNRTAKPDRGHEGDANTQGPNERPALGQAKFIKTYIMPHRVVNRTGTTQQRVSVSGSTEGPALDQSKFVQTYTSPHKVAKRPTRPVLASTPISKTSRPGWVSPPEW